MQSLHDKSGSDGESTPSGKGGGFTDPSGRKVDLRSIVAQANTIPLTTILASYGQRVDEYNRRIRCPFHKGGGERTPSFWVYPDTNTFHCFGCKVSGRPVEYVGIAESMNKLEAAFHIIEKWGCHINSANVVIEQRNSYSEKALLEFSDYIRNFIRKNEASPEALQYVENLCYSFDKMNQKYDLNNEGLSALIDKIKSRLEIYK